MGVVILIIIVGGVSWLIILAKQQAALKRAAQEAFKTEHAGWDIYFSPYDQVAIAINHDARALVLGTTKAHKRYAWSSIASVELVRDGTSITSTNRGSQLMGAAVGEVLLGPLGLLIGGVSGSKRTVQRVSQIGLKIIVDDRVSPIYTIDFLRLPGSGADPKNKLVKSAAQRAEHVHALLVNAIRNSSQTRSAPRQINDRSVGDRIDQLWKLKEAGALTDAEFEEQKALVLNALAAPKAGVR
ncbi:MAG TPA: hypothetical protein VFT61_00410 [Sphingomicrobium sp.]|jgi:hypothetical protein|nr:hypothetical protein [Sphingomicrobium sp.]